MVNNLGPFLAIFGHFHMFQECKKRVRDAISRNLTHLRGTKSKNIPGPHWGVQNSQLFSELASLVRLQIASLANISAMFW